MSQRYDDPDSPDYQETNVGEGMIPERKKKAPTPTEPAGTPGVADSIHYWMERAETAELALSQAKRDAERMVKLLVEARDNLIWCGGSADFGPGGQAKVGYDKGPRVTIAAIADALDAALAKREGEGS